MSSLQINFLLQALSKINLYRNNEEECTMVTVNFSDEGEFCPRLFQVIKQKDGYLYQLLEEGTHQRLETGKVTEEELVTLLPKMEGGREADLTWGPHCLF